MTFATDFVALTPARTPSTRSRKRKVSALGTWRSMRGGDLVQLILFVGVASLPLALLNGAFR